MDATLSNGSAFRDPAGQHERLSYKFQRLRERIRQAIQSGELAGKLPGERELARRFKANPKTLSKALTDLAAEGLLDRSIGRGTYVRGTTPEAPLQGKWLVICDPEQQSCSLVDHLRSLHADVEVISSETRLRPSLISQFSVVIDAARATSNAFHRDLLVRGISVVLIGREGSTHSLNAVMLDRHHATYRLARDLFLAGHHRILVVEDAADPVASAAVRLASRRYAEHATVEPCRPDDILRIVDQRGVAIVCDGAAQAQKIAAMMLQYPHLSQLSLVAVGVTEEPPCTGIYTTPKEMAATAAGLVANGQNLRPAVLWLTGELVDRGTLHVVPDNPCDIRVAGHRTAISA